MSEPIDWKALTPEQRNRLVATKVMSWTEQPCDLDSCIGMELAIDSDGFASCPRCGAYNYIGNLEHGIIPPPRYSESMDAAMLVIKKMRNEYQGLWRITVYPDDAITPNAVTLTLRHKEVGYRGAFLAEAICITALHALGENQLE